MSNKVAVITGGILLIKWIVSQNKRHSARSAFCFKLTIDKPIVLWYNNKCYISFVISRR